MGNISLAAEYCRVIEIKLIGLFYRICDYPSITFIDGRNNYPISITPFFVSVEHIPAFTIFA